MRAASLGQLARATATAVPPAGAALAKPVPPAGALPLVQAPGNFLWTRVLPYAPYRSLSISKLFWALKSLVSLLSLVHKITMYTCCLYGAGHMDLDVGKSISRGV